MTAALSFSGMDRLGRTTQQRDGEIYWFLVDYVEEHGWAPTYREILAATQCSHLQQVQNALQRLQERGLIAWLPGQARCIRLTNQKTMRRTT